jgi:D-alanine-D-alanine ligase
MRATDKALAKLLMREAGIPTPPFHSLRETAIKDLGGAGALASIERSLGFPLVVKPARGGSALGVKFASESSGLPSAMVGALSYDDTVVLERHVRGRDLAVSVLEPAELEPETTARAQELALEVYRLLGCHGFARVDLMLEEDTGELWVLETNVVPGLTQTSLLPQAADAGGVSFDELLERILASAFTRG